MSTRRKILIAGFATVVIFVAIGAILCTIW